MEETNLNILLLDEHSDDVERIHQTLSEQLVSFHLSRARSASELEMVLQHGPPDLVLSEYLIGSWQGGEALAQVRAFDRWLPFIIVSDTISDDQAVALLRAGATDYLCKHQLALLGYMVERALGERQQRQLLTDAENARWRSEKHYNTVLNNIRDAFVMIDAQGTILEWNQAAETLFGYHYYQAVGQKVHDLLTTGKESDEMIEGLKRFSYSGEGPLIGNTFEVNARHKDGHTIAVELSLSALFVDDHWHGIGLARDIRTRKQHEASLQYSYPALFTK